MNINYLIEKLSLYFCHPIKKRTFRFLQFFPSSSLHFQLHTVSLIKGVYKKVIGWGWSLVVLFEWRKKHFFLLCTSRIRSDSSSTFFFSIYQSPECKKLQTTNICQKQKERAISSCWLFLFRVLFCFFFRSFLIGYRFY